MPARTRLSAAVIGLPPEAQVDLVEGVGERLPVGAERRERVQQPPLALLRQLQEPDAPVRGRLPPLDQAGLLRPPHELCHCRLLHLQQPAQLCDAQLRLAVASRADHQQQVVAL